MQNLDTYRSDGSNDSSVLEAMAAVTLQFLQHTALYLAGLTVTPNSRRGPDDMEIDVLTRKGKGHEGKGTLCKTERQKTCCW